MIKYIFLALLIAVGIVMISIGLCSLISPVLSGH
jgi:hypothetical protein